MKKNLPGVFANSIDKKFNNNNDFSYTKNEDRDFKISEKKDKAIDVRRKINSIFSSKNYVYKADVIIKTNGETITRKIIGKNNNNLITIDNQLIPISSIEDIDFSK